MKRLLDSTTCRGNLLGQEQKRVNVDEELKDETFEGFSNHWLKKDVAITTNPRRWKNIHTMEHDLNPEFLPRQHKILNLINSKNQLSNYEFIYTDLRMDMFDLLFVEVCSIKRGPPWPWTEVYDQKQFYTALDEIKRLANNTRILWLTHINLPVGKKIQKEIESGNQSWLDRTTSDRKLKSRDTIDKWMREYSNDVLYPGAILGNKTLDDVCCDGMGAGGGAHYNETYKRMTENFYIKHINSII